ncbi:MAG: transglutaminase-like domain-containing protein [Pseudomonadota bacterium]
MSSTRTGLTMVNLVKVAIVIPWLIMMAVLVGRIHFVPEIKLSPAEELSDSESYMAIYLKGRKTGYSEQILARNASGYLMNNNTYLRLNLMGEIQELRTLTSAQLDESLGLRTFDFFMSAGPIRYQLAGRVDGLNLELVSQTGGHRSKSILRLDEVPRLASGLAPFLAKKGLKKGERFSLPIFDPSTLSTKSVQVVVEDKETIEVEGREVDAFRVRMDYFDVQSYTWIDEAGRVQKEEGLLGLSMVRTTEDQAREGLVGKADLTDLVAATSAPTSGVLAHPRDVRFLKARLKGVDLTGFDLSGGRQVLNGEVVEVRRETIDVRDEAAPLPRDPHVIPFTYPSQFIQSDDHQIISQARALTEGAASPLDKIDRIVKWVYETLEKRPTMSVPSAVDVLETKVGDCNEHAVLAAGLLRAAGVPTKTVVGVLYFDGRFYYHAWIEAYWGRWLAADPLLGQVPADASHIRFLTGDISRQAEMVRVIGRLEVEILEDR